MRANNLCVIGSILVAHLEAQTGQVTHKIDRF
jgi:hypothetical protein